MPQPINATASSYVSSHLADGRGASYDAYYCSDPWLVYACARDKEVVRTIRRTLLKGKDVNLLDFACGTGRILEDIENEVGSACGVDVSESMLTQASQKVKRSSLLRTNLLNEQPFGRFRFDLITSFRFFVNAEPELRRAALRVLVSLLADDGYLVLNNHHNRYSLRRTYQRLVARIRRRPCDVTFMTIGECRELVADAGLEIVAVHSVGLFYVPGVVLPPIVHGFFDRVIGRVSWIAAWAESPILVCRKRRAAQRPA